MGAAGVGRMAQDLVDLLMLRLGSSGLANMRGATIASQQGGCHAALPGEQLAQRLPTVVAALCLELQAQHVHEWVGQHADEQMPLDPAINLLEHRAKAQVGLQGPEHRLHVGQHRVRAPQRGVVLLHQRRAQAVHAPDARPHCRA